MRRNDVELFLSSSENGSHLLGWECNDDDNGDCMKSRALYIRDVSTNYQYYRIGTLFITEDGTQTIAWKMMDIPDEEQKHLPLQEDE